jgi:hypothetical protein
MTTWDEARYQLFKYHFNAFLQGKSPDENNIKYHMVDLDQDEVIFVKRYK